LHVVGATTSEKSGNPESVSVSATKHKFALALSAVAALCPRLFTDSPPQTLEKTCRSTRQSLILPIPCLLYETTCDPEYCIIVILIVLVLIRLKR